MKISIVGTGYLGLTTGVVLAKAGFDVYCIDIDPKIIETIKKGKAHFFEPYLDILLKEVVKNKKLIPTINYKKAIPNSEISFICVNTPGNKNGELSISSVKNSVTSVAQNISKDNHIILIKSTVPTGTAKIIKPVISKHTSKQFFIVRNPEFLAEGSAVLDTIFPDRIIIGTDSDYAFTKTKKIFKKVDNFAKKLLKNSKTKKEILQFSKTYRNKFNFEIPFDERLIKTNIESAELIKITANSYLTMKISYANAISNICEKTDADVNEVMDGIGMDPRIGRDFLYAGLGWGGGCFPKDLKGLIKDAEKVGYNFKLLKEVNKINSKQIDLVISKTKKLFNKNLKDKIITVLGLSYKPGTCDTRKSPAIKLIKKLSPLIKQVKVYDPKAIRNARKQMKKIKNIQFSDNIENATKSSSLLILATDWPEFINIDFQKIHNLMKEPNLLDARNKWNKNKTKKFNYTGIGI